MSETSRPKFKTRTIRLVGETQRDTAIAMLNNLPLDAEHPLEIVAREEVKVRKQSANDAMWAGALKDIAEQAWINKRQYSAEIWHEHMKREYLPEDDDPDLAELVKDWETWRKWDVDPAGNRICIGSTTRLTRKGFAIYNEKVHAFGAGLGVMFSEAPQRGMT